MMYDLPLPAWLVTTCALLLFCIACGLFLLYHRFLKKVVKEGNDSVFDLLLMMMAICSQTFCCIKVVIILNFYMVLSGFIDFYPTCICIVLNIRFLTGTILLGSMFLTSILFFCFYTLPTLTTNWNLRATQNLSLLFLLTCPLYQLFVTTMTCGKEAFCPPSYQRPGKFLPDLDKEQDAAMQQLLAATTAYSMTSLDCRELPAAFVRKTLGFLMVAAIAACLMKVTWPYSVVFIMSILRPSGDGLSRPLAQSPSPRPPCPTPPSWQQSSGRVPGTWPW
jgi:hypothetical protein